MNGKLTSHNLKKMEKPLGFWNFYKCGVYVILVGCLIISCPIFFTEANNSHLFGFPPWAFYSFCVTVLFAVIGSLVLHFFWPLLSGDDDE